MNCDERAELTPLYLSGELDHARTAAFQSHLESCSICAREIEQHGEIEARLREEFLRERLETAALERNIATKIAGRVKRETTVRTITIAASVAAILLAGTIVYRSHLQAELAAHAAQDHHREVIDREPRRWVSEPNAVEELARREGVAVEAIAALNTSFPQAGYHFERAKLCRLGKSRFLHLVFSDGVQEFSIFLAPGQAVKSAKIVCADLGPDHVAAFRDAQVQAFVVTDQPGDAALRLARSAASVM